MRGTILGFCALCAACAVALSAACVGDEATQASVDSGAGDGAADGSGGDASDAASDAGACVLDGSGKQQFAYAYPVGGSFRSVQYDPSGNALIGGVFDTAGDVGQDASVPMPAGGADILVFKRAPASAGGATLWLKTFGGPKFDNLWAMVTDGAGDVYIAGDTSSPTLALDALTLTNPNNGPLGFLAKLSGSDGHALWVQPLTPSGPSPASHCTTLASTGTRLAVGCNFSAMSVDYPSGGLQVTLPTFTGSNALIGLFDATTGDFNSITQLGPAGTTSNGTTTNVQSLDFQLTGDLLASGVFSGPVLRDSAGMQPSVHLNRVGMLNDGWVALLDGKGKAIWAKDVAGVGTTGSVTTLDVVRDGMSGAVIAGAFASSVDLGNGPITVAGGGDDDLFVAHLGNMAGPPDWTKAFGGPLYDRLDDISFQGCQLHPVVAMRLSGNVTLDGVVFPAPQQGGSASVVATFAPDGTALWAHGTSPPAGSTLVPFMVHGSFVGNVQVVGYFNGVVDLGGTMITQTNGTASPFFLSYLP